MAATPQQKHAGKRPSAQGRERPVVPSITSQVVGKVPLNTAAQDATKKPCYIAEEMVMQRAWTCSAILPGWGQVYNEHYWKIPVIYVGFAGLGCGAIYYHREYVNCKEELIQKKGIEINNLANYVNDCRTGRDLCIMFAVFWYVVNIFDAYVGSSLKTFTLSDDISMEVQPSMLSMVQSKPTMGLSLTLNFRK